MLLGLANLWLIVGFLVFTQALLISARLPGERIAWGWTIMLPILVLVPLWPVFYQEGACWSP